MPNIANFQDYNTPVEHQIGLLSLFPGNEGKLWILHYLVETYNITLDIRYDSGKRGWTYRVAGSYPQAQNKLVYFSKHGEMLDHAHFVLNQILDNSTNALAE